VLAAVWAKLYFSSTTAVLLLTIPGMFPLRSLSNGTLSGWLPNNTANMCVDWEGVICYDGRVALLLLYVANFLPQDTFSVF
jgi:hypothetical protein